MSDNSERSLPHRRVEKILDAMQLAYESEKIFEPYRVDIYLPEWHCAVEIDGPYHLKKADTKRDEFLREIYKLPVLRIKTQRKNYRSSTPSFIAALITAFIEESAITTKARKSEWLMTL